MPLPIARSLIFTFLIVTSTSAAPPTANYFFPPGGQRGTTVTVDVAGAGEPWPPQSWADQPGLEITPAKKPGKVSIAIAPDAIPGTYWIRLWNKEGSSIARPFIVGTLPEVMEKEPNDELQKPQVLEKNQIVVNGRLEKNGDADLFAVPLEKGQTLVASVDAYRTLRSTMDGILQILSPEGFVLDQNHDFYEMDPLLVFPAPKTGTYLVRVLAFPSVPDSGVRFSGGDKYIYRLTLTTGPFVDYPYPLAVSAKGPKEVELTGWNLSEKLRTFPVALPAPIGKLRIQGDGVGNTANLAVDSLPVILKSAMNSRSSPQSIELPANLVGRLEKPGDVDAYQFEGKKGQRVFWKMESRSLGLALDPVIRFPDMGGKLEFVKAAKIGDEPSVVTVLPKDGTFHVEVYDLNREGGSRDAYRLRANIEPEFDMKVANDRFVLVPGTPLDLPITIDRQIGHVGDIEIQVEGLPKEISVKPTVTAKTATLQLKTDLPEWSGSFRIFGKTKVENRIASANYPEYSATTTQLWLTVSAQGKVATPVPPKKKGTMQ